MIKLDILSLLKAKGKSKYWLYKQLGRVKIFSHFSLQALA